MEDGLLKLWCLQHGQISAGEHMVANGENACPHDHDEITLLVTESEYLEAWGQSMATENPALPE